MMAIPPPVQVVQAGPPARVVHGNAPGAASFQSKRAVQKALQETTGAVVVVEAGGSPLVMPKQPKGLSLFNGKLNLFQAREPINGGWVLAPFWTDTYVIISNANAATRNYDFFGVEF